MFPAELELKHETSDNDKSASYLNLQLDVLNGEITTSLYDKRDYFPFKIVNFPDLSGNIPQARSYGVFIAQTLRYAKSGAKYTDFITRTLRLKNQLIKQHFHAKVQYTCHFTTQNTTPLESICKQCVGRQGAGPAHKQRCSDVS